jgi:hypothetical protein
MARGQVYLPPSGSQINQFETQGFPGEYHSPLAYTSGQIDLTGSNYGYGAVMVVTHGGATLHYAGGTSSLASDITAKDIYNLSVAKITGGTGSKIYLFKRQQ